ncbi:transcriptional regulator [Superficieibacter electus]|uniref:Transcriptional regulator n=1 Tax=Superficieibacter electus TaxID=2022662 RepID=A0A2P5GPR9_9ENTR|nr:HTH-type transcriptional regulator [Superficieibacter electus]POP45255.1 transcriptional regulator [Superficieibacter electus]POP48539.1 transcriptional regulator [Superficieibacter electus]
MEYNDPMIELMNNLELIVFKDLTQKITLPQQPKATTEIAQLRKGTGLKLADFAKAVGVPVSTVQEWESKRVKPSATELKLMRLIQANPKLSKELME